VNLAATPNPRALGLATTPDPRALDVGLVARSCNENMINK